MARAAIVLMLAACTGGTAQLDSGDPPAPTPPGQLALSPTEISFGTVPLGEARTNTVLLQNVGDGPLRIHDVQFQDDQARAFWTVSGGTSGVLAAGEQTELAVRLDARTIGSLDARLLVLSDDPAEETQRVSLQATSEGAPAARLSPTGVLDFGVVVFGETPTAVVTIANDGTAPLQVLEASLVGADSSFSITVDPTGTTVAPQSEDGLVQLRFSPPAAGTWTNSLVLHTNDPTSPEVLIALTGIATEP